VRTASFYRGILAITTTDHLWGGWALKVAPSDAPVVEELKRYLGPGVWLDDRQARIRFFRVFVVDAILIVLAFVGFRLLSHVERLLR
jgi:hypothetical protein